MNQPDGFVDALRAIVGAANVITDASGMETYMNEERGLFHGTARAVVRPGSTAEVAAVVAFLLSDDASYVNATVIPIDGGQSAKY